MRMQEDDPGFARQRQSGFRSQKSKNPEIGSEFTRPPLQYGPDNPSTVETMA